MFWKCAFLVPFWMRTKFCSTWYQWAMRSIGEVPPHGDPLTHPITGGGCEVAALLMTFNICCKLSTGGFWLAGCCCCCCAMGPPGGMPMFMRTFEGFGPSSSSLEYQLSFSSATKQLVSFPLASFKGTKSRYFPTGKIILFIVRCLFSHLTFVITSYCC